VLEDLAYQLAGHAFSLTSVDDIGRVLYAELRLPVNGETETPGKTLGTRRTATSRYSCNMELSRVASRIRHEIFFCLQLY